MVLDILHRAGSFEIVGLLDNYKPLGSTCGAHVVIGRLGELPQLAREHENLGMVVAIGDNWVRGRVVSEIRATFPAIQFVRAIHPSAQIAMDACVGDGAVIMAGAVVNPGASVGEFCIVNTRASLDHDSVMSEYSSLGPAATTGGGVRLGSYSNIGIGATVVQEIVVGEHTVIGAGAVVLHSLPDRVVAYGVPARVIRPRVVGERYLGDIHMTAGQAK
ncbi:MAG: acetyltransferase [Bryobacteraceae bacterium]|nr:acetyltransferase [Bryobacteraceae bacterium]